MSREIEMELPCDLDDQDVTERALSMSTTMTEIDEVDSAMRDASKAYKERLQFLRGRLRALGRAVKDRSERRIVRCAVNFHEPIVGMKQIVRLDTGELVKEEPMTDSEKQKNLFAPSIEPEPLEDDDPDDEVLEAGPELDGDG